MVVFFYLGSQSCKVSQIMKILLIKYIFKKKYRGRKSREGGRQSSAPCCYLSVMSERFKKKYNDLDDSTSVLLATHDLKTTWGTDHTSTFYWDEDIEKDRERESPQPGRNRSLILISDVVIQVIVTSWVFLLTPYLVPRRASLINNGSRD